jgi:uncharacterized membrane protein YgaE (UPF0421/DUF939 family)
MVVGNQWRTAIQAGTAAGLSWWIASELVGHADPLSAPVVAVISIGASLAGRARRTLDVVLGVSVGVGLATLAVASFGRSALLLALLVTAAMLTAAAARGGDLLVMQAGVAAILVFTGDADSTGAALTRLADALIGGGSAVLISLFVLPPDPVKLLSARFEPLLAELGAILDDVSVALRQQDAARAAAALERARATDGQVAELHAARPVALEIARLVPTRRRTRTRAARLASAAVHLDHAIRNGRILARAALAMLGAEETVRKECASAVDELARAVRGDPREVAELGRAAAARLATYHQRSPSVALGAVATATRGIADDLALANR